MNDDVQEVVALLLEGGEFDYVDERDVAAVARAALGDRDDLGPFSITVIRKLITDGLMIPGDLLPIADEPAQAHRVWARIARTFCRPEVRVVDFVAWPGSRAEWLAQLDERWLNFEAGLGRSANRSGLPAPGEIVFLDWTDEARKRMPST